MRSRREFLECSGGGMGALALWQLLAVDRVLADPTSKGKLNGGLHHPAKAKRVIQLFMNGGASQMDLLDYKPLLQAKHVKNSSQARVNESKPPPVCPAVY